MSKYGVISGPYFPVLGLSVFSPNKRKYRPEITPYLNTFYAVDKIKIERKYSLVPILYLRIDIHQIVVTLFSKPDIKPFS